MLLSCNSSLARTVYAAAAASTAAAAATAAVS
jgi:hypothetical protein